jgi:hypothetical protein
MSQALQRQNSGLLIVDWTAFVTEGPDWRDLAVTTLVGRMLERKVLLLIISSTAPRQ